MNDLWVLKGPHEAPGWLSLESDARSNKLEVLLFDRDAWALVRAKEAPTQYEGLPPAAAEPGLYLDNQGRGIYIAGGKVVKSPGEVLATLGAEAQELARKLKDPDLALERLGRVY